MEKPTTGIVVDGACSVNPGPAEYRGLDLVTGKQLFSNKFPHATNNIAEFVAIVHALMICKRDKIQTTIYSDSATAITWVNKKRCNTTLVDSIKSEKARQFAKRCEDFLSKNNDLQPVEKWLTKQWNEIPADYGNKR